MTIQDLPALNATLNGIATTLLISGFIAIKRKNIYLHRRIMTATLLVSAAFLTSYLIYHYNTAAVTPFQGEGILRWVYYTILFTHIPLATAMVPFIFWAVAAAVKQNLVRHRQLVRWVWPVWLYVSVTGVIIYFMLYQMTSL